MKYGRHLKKHILKEWRFYSLDYKSLKQALKGKSSESDDEETVAAKAKSLTIEEEEEVLPPNVELFNSTLETSLETIKKFYSEKERWALEYKNVLDERVLVLKKSKKESELNRRIVENELVGPFEDETEDDEMDSEESDDEGGIKKSESSGGLKKSDSSSSINGRSEEDQAALKQEYLAAASDKHFKDYIYSIKSLRTFDRELELLMDFLRLNLTGIRKILKKFDKVLKTSTLEAKFADIVSRFGFLEGEVLQGLRVVVDDMINRTINMKPLLPAGWSDRKVYTIGCFDLFHRGHANVLHSLREFGHFLVAGIHDDESYFKLKKKYPIDNLETRMENVKPHVDVIFVIPSTDPLPFIRAAVSQNDINAGLCCYARGDDMTEFPSKEWVESVMPIHFVPRTEACSSTLIRTIYHGGDAKLMKKAAFAKTRYDGKPVDEDGNVLNLKKKPVVVENSSVPNAMDLFAPPPAPSAAEAAKKEAPKVVAAKKEKKEKPDWMKSTNSSHQTVSGATGEALKKEIRSALDRYEKAGREGGTTTRRNIEGI